jgi:hypothetical protein
MFECTMGVSIGYVFLVTEHFGRRIECRVIGNERIRLTIPNHVSKFCDFEEYSPQVMLSGSPKAHSCSKLRRLVYNEDAPCRVTCIQHPLSDPLHGDVGPSWDPKPVANNNISILLFPNYNCPQHMRSKFNAFSFVEWAS